MKLYHGTSEAVAMKALSEGLKPRGKRKGIWSHSVESHPNAVYLTNSYALYFAMQAAEKPMAGRPAVIEIDTNKLDIFSLAPDEDCLEQAMRKFDSLDPSWSMIKRTKYYRKNLEKYCDAASWKQSLKALGNCCHLGWIHHSAITRIAIVDPAEQADLCFQSLDPTISLMNYQIVGDKYRGLTKWLFDEPLGEDAPVNRFGDMPISELTEKFGISQQAAEKMRWSYILPENRDGIKILEKGA